MKNWRLADNATVEERRALQKYCREICKTRLLEDIKKDLIVCKIEGWDWKEYLYELINLIKSFLKEAI